MGVSPTFPVNVTTTLQIMKPKNTIGMVSLAVKPSDMTLHQSVRPSSKVTSSRRTYVLTVAASGGASMSLVQYAQ